MDHHNIEQILNVPNPKNSTTINATPTDEEGAYHLSTTNFSDAGMVDSTFLFLNVVNDISKQKYVVFLMFYD